MKATPKQFHVALTRACFVLTAASFCGSETSLAVPGDSNAFANGLPSATLSVVTAWGDNSSGQTNVPAGLTNAVALAGGGEHSLALKADGTVTAWGTNTYGQTSVPAGLTNVVAIAAGYMHSLALKSDGTVAAWGNNSYGQTSVPATLTNGAAIAAGYLHSLALKTDGTVVAWGDDSYGQTRAPNGLNRVVAIACGAIASVALQADGTVVVWGYSGTGQTTVPAGLTNAVAIAAGFVHNLALKADGTVVAWGDNSYGQATVPPGLTNVVAIAAGDYHNLALKADGTVVAWGDNSNGQTNVPPGLMNVAAIAAGADHSLALLGTVPPFVTVRLLNQTVAETATISLHVEVSGTPPLAYQWSFNGTNLPGATNGMLTLNDMGFGDAGTYSVVVSNPFGTVTNSCQVEVVPLLITSQPQSLHSFRGATLSFSVVAVGQAPLSYQWQLNGSSLPDQTNSVLLLTNVQPAQVGAYSVVVSNALDTVSSAIATLSLSQVAAWGEDSSGQTDVPSGLPNAIAISAGYSHSLALNADGTVVAWGNNSYGQTAVPSGLTNVVAISAGGYHSLAIKSDGKVAGWGADWFGQTDVPAGLTKAVAVAAGYFHSVALSTNGTVVAWGDNSDLQTAVPSALTNAVAISAGLYHSLALKSDGTVVAWGDSTYGQTNVPAGLTNVVAIAAGYYHNLALKSNGTVVGWGDNSYGDAVAPSGLTNAVAVAAGEFHSLALRADGTVVAWGDNTYGQTNVPAGLAEVVAIACGAGNDLALLAGAPRIKAQPQSQIVVVGGSATFSVNVAGLAPFYYQWQFNGTNLAGATSAAFTLTNAALSDSGNYAVLITNSGGAVLSSNAVLTVVPILVVMEPANRISSTSAILNASVTPGAYDTLVWFEWGTNANYGNETVAMIVPAGYGAVAISNVLNGLSTDFDYHYRLVASNALGVVYGDDQTFNLRVPPIAVTLPPTRVTANGATLNASVNPEGENTTVYFQWGSTSAYGQSTRAVNLSGNTAASVSSGIIGLTPSLYHCRVVASNRLAVAFGADVGFGFCQTDWNDVYQRIDGFGASSAWRSTWTAAQADMFFSTNGTGIGLSLLRNHVTPANSPSSTDIPSTSEISVMQMAQARGALVWSAPWTPAAGFKSSGSLNGGNYNGSGANATNLAYASQLANYVLNMKTNYGVNLYAISIQNEPDFSGSYESCLWSGQQFHDFVTNLYNALVANGVGSTKIVIPESEHWSINMGLYTPTLNDSNSAAVVSVIADHNYDNCPPSGTPMQLSTSGKSLWETEVSKLSCAGSYDGSMTDGMYWATRIHLFLTSAQVNAWHYWWLISANPDNEGLTDQSGNPAKRMYVLGNYSRFVRPGYYRIGVTGAGSITAYQDTNSASFALVAINSDTSPRTQAFNLTNFPAIQIVTPWITSSNLSLAAQAPVAVINGCLTYTLPAMSVTTLVGQSPPRITTQPTNQTVTIGGTATFSVVAEGAPPLSYQWLKDGTNLTGATDSTLTLTNVQKADQGTYSATVSNAFGLVVSSNAFLVVNQFPVAQCQNLIVSAGTNCLADASVDNGSFDPDGNPITLSQSPPGSYPLGTNLVTLTVADNFGASNACTALVIVLDRTPPQISCPASIVTSNDFNQCGAVVTFPQPTATDYCSPITNLTCAPPSGSSFPVGTTTVQCAATDSAGNVGVGSFTVTVRDTQPPTITCPADIVVTNAHNAWTSVVTFNPTVSDNCSGVGLPVCVPASGSAFGLGTNLVSCSVSDAAGNSSQCSFHVTVWSGNRPPVPVIRVLPLARCLGWANDQWCRHGWPHPWPPTNRPCWTNLIVIACNNTNAKVICDGSKSYDPDGDTFKYNWFNGTNRFSTNKVAVTVLPLGTNVITLFLDDTFAGGTNSASATVKVFSPAQAVGLLTNLVGNSSLSARQQRPLLATLNAAIAAFKRGQLISGLSQLKAFQNQVRAELNRSNPGLANELIQGAQQIIDALGQGGEGRHGGEFGSLRYYHGGKTRLQITGAPDQIHLVQASTNLSQWETIGVAADSGDGSFNFEDPDAARFPNRFYRIVSP